jgi:HTH-type transcriptional regulator / antitoxin HigA
MTTLDEARYAELLKEKHPRIIRTEKENDQTLREIDALMARGEDLTPEEAELLELLTMLVERFEEEHYPMQTSSPREVLRELMDARGMTQAELSGLFPSKGIASEVLAGKREISKAQARKLGTFFHVSAALFLDV